MHSLPREDEIAQAVKEQLCFRRYFQPRRSPAPSIRRRQAVAEATTREGAPVAFTTDAVLVAPGRRANVQGLDLDKVWR